MKQVFRIFSILLLSQQAYSQHVYQIRADSVRIYNVCDTAELIIENRTRGVAGFLFNKSNGRTEFRRLQLETIGGNRIAITGQDTLDISTLPGIGGVDTIYRDADSIRYIKRGAAYALYAPLPSYLNIPEGESYGFSQFLPNRLTAFSAYNSPDMPMVSNQSLAGQESGRSFYTGHTVHNGSYGYQMAVNWDGELTGPKGAFIRNKDDTQSTWGAWRELMFKDHADNTFAPKEHRHDAFYYTKQELQTGGQASVHWNNVTGAPSFSLNETLQNVTDRGSTTSHTITANAFNVRDAGTLLEQGAGGSLKIATPFGYTEVGSQNAGWSHFITSLPSFYFEKDVHVNGVLRRYNSTGFFDGGILGLQSGDGNGIRFWDGDLQHSIWMSNATHGTFGGRVFNYSGNDYNLYFKITGYNRGFVFIPGNNTPVVQIDNEGIYTNKWFRSVGDGGWYSETYGGGWYMLDNTWIRSYNGKSILQDVGIMRTDGTLQVGQNGSTLNVPNGQTPTIYGNTIWHAGNDGSGSGLDADLLDGLHASDITGNWGQITDHAATNSFNGVSRFGATFINGVSGVPGYAPSSGLQYYSWMYGLGAPYTSAQYGLQFAFQRNLPGLGPWPGPYLYARQLENASWDSWSKIWAGNSDAVGGITSDRIVYGDGGASSRHVSGGDINGLAKSGWYDGSNMTGAPSGEWYNIIHSEHVNQNGYSNQLAQRFTPNNEVAWYARTKHNNAWGAWRELWHSGNLAFSVSADASKLAQRDASGQLYATGFYQSSHSSLKQNIKIFSEAALPLVNSLVIKEFSYKNDKENSVHFGIIADSSDWHFATKKYDRFDTNSSLAIAIKAIQELSKEKEQLRKQVSSLEERLRRLEELMGEKLEK